MGGIAGDLSSVSRILFSLIGGACICPAQRSGHPHLDPQLLKINATVSSTGSFYGVG